jgi:hypothetical protein
LASVVVRDDGALFGMLDRGLDLVLVLEEHRKGRAEQVKDAPFAEPLLHTRDVRLDGARHGGIVRLGDGADAVREVRNRALDLLMVEEHGVHELHVVMERGVGVLHGHGPAHRPGLPLHHHPRPHATAAFCIWNVGVGFLAGIVGAYMIKRDWLKL